MSSSSNMRPILTKESGWLTRLHQVNLMLFALLPAALLSSRGLAEIAVAAIGLSFLSVTVARRDWSAAKQPISIVLLLTWLSLNFVVSPLANDITASFSRSLPWLRFIVLFAAVSSWLIQSRADLRLIAIAWAVTLVAVMADGMAQLVFGASLSGQHIFGNRLTGPLDRPNIGIFATRLGFPVLAAWILLLLLSPPGKAVFRTVALLSLGSATVVFIFLTGERAASLLTILAVLCVVAIVVFVLPQYRLHGAVGLVLMGLGAVTVLQGSERIMERAESAIKILGDVWDSLYGQLIETGLRMWLDNPLTGVGLRGFRAACETYLPQGIISECAPHPHNIYVEWLAESGLIGFLGFVAFVVLFTWSILRLLRRTGQPVVGALLVGCLIVTLMPFSVGQSFFSNWPAMLLWCSLSLVGAIARLAETITTPESRPLG